MTPKDGYTPDRPLVFIDITGGCVQAEYIFDGTGKPEVIHLDLDMPYGEGWEAETIELADQLDAAMACMALRAVEADDVAAVASYRKQASELREEAGGDLNPEGDPTRNGAFG